MNLKPHSLRKLNSNFTIANISSHVQNSTSSRLINKGDSRATNHYVSSDLIPALQNVKNNASI